MEVQVKVDLSAIGKFAKTLEKDAATVLRWRIRKAVTDAGGAMLAEARRNAASQGLAKAAAATSLRTSFAARSAGVTIRTDPRRAPAAYYFERGSRGSGGRYIRHPVYGSPNSRDGGAVTRYENKSTWRNIPTRPFFFKAATSGRVDFEGRLQQEVDYGLHELGFTI